MRTDPDAPLARAPVCAIALRALFYALLIAGIVLLMPLEPHEFIYQGF